ncbi:MAG: RagB/SusD family nutrient uptake outer membrane protein [Prevotellaceae bacterium]|jgi:hypothetical protein|nr:RagB/SusD family nutrient uptake outer membrane protein [Prevotellaceae bacterium]
MKKIYKIALLGLLLIAGSCSDYLDEPPKYLVTDEDLLSNDAGLKIYTARMYSYLPIEDFKYLGKWGFNFSSWLGSFGVEATGEALTRDDFCRSFTGEDTPYWGMAFTLLRDANYLIENLPKYRENFAEPLYNQHLGQGYFVRAFVFYAMARRFGGVPLVTWVMEYPNEKEALEVPRSTEEETWDQVLADFDRAAELLLPASPTKNMANKFVALAYKSEAMLYAGCVAKYNQTVSGNLTGFGQKTGVRVIGFDPNTWQAASKRYFKEAYKAARQVMTDGGYSLYKKAWSATDREKQYQNMIDMFNDLSSPENIFVREYEYPTVTHGIDAYSSPFIFRAPLSAGTCPTLDFLELFDGFDRYPDGTVKVTSGNSNTQGSYLLYDSPMDFFANAEPRLRAYVIFPGDRFKGENIIVRGGVYTGATPITPLFTDYSYASFDTRYQHASAYTGTPRRLFLSPNTGASQVKIDGVADPETGETPMLASGANGPFYENGEATITGFYLRKWLKDDPSFSAGEGKSDQPFILMRYADVLLNAAEAAIELTLAGESSPDGSDMIQVATTAINDIRERAGATLLTGNLPSNEDGRNTVRKERRKELAFEHKTKWDLRRWRVSHYEGRDGFWGEARNKDTYSNTTSFRFRGLYPFYSSVARKYFFDARFQWVSPKTFSYGPLDYYFAIPSGEVTKSEVIDQQPNR